MAVRLMESLATTGPLAEIFSDESVMQAMLDFEAALARAEARAGVIPQGAAQIVISAAKADGLDAAELARQTLLSGTPAIPLVKALTERVRAQDAVAAGYVHWGATSQDVTDTALVLLLKRALPVIDSDLDRLQTALHRLSDQHAHTVMLGRTLLQAAPPVTFGLKAAGWLAAVRRGRVRLSDCFHDAQILQFGGASGTGAALAEQGIAVGQALAAELKLSYPDAPWHTHRDRLAALVCACGVLGGSLGKIARDISLLMQNEVAEVAELAGEGRGGSSTMPHKKNPVGCAVTLAQAYRLPGLVSSYLSVMLQEHERAVGGWHAEWPILSNVIQSTGLAAASMAEVAEGITVNPARMRANIEATGGAVFAERAMMLLAEKLGRDSAHKLLEEATRKSAEQGNQLSQVLETMPEVAKHLDAAVLKDLETPEHYVGMAEEFRKRLLDSAKQPIASGSSESKKE
jgi:3-carboxy-cis,cis-muconate cycloisomerase